MKTVALVPVKEMSQAKSRLDALLNPQEKAALSRAMLMDVLDVLRRTRGLDKVVVVTRDATAQGIAEDRGIPVISEPPDVMGEGPAVDYAAELIFREGGQAVLVIPADLPSATASDLEAVLATLEDSPFVAMVPAKDGGTNALLKAPPFVIPSRFGLNSLQLHIEEAKRRGVPYKVLRLPSLALDIDVPADLAVLMQRSNHTNRTHRLFTVMGLSTRLREWPRYNLRYQREGDRRR